MTQAPEQQMARALARMLNQGDAIGVLARADVARQRFPYAPSFQFLRGIAIARLGRPREVADAMRMMLDQLPTDARPEADADVARVMLEAGRAEDAIALAEAAPGTSAALTAVHAEALLAAGRADDASKLVEGGGGESEADRLELAIARAKIAIAADPSGASQACAEARTNLNERVGVAGGSAIRRAEALRVLGDMQLRVGAT
ncbi:MAG: hypothetical protein CMJ31_11485, partial [Phycisphaerae bacterium]|nr:hypothetical protein [Phycisphaerae bacterium]